MEHSSKKAVLIVTVPTLDRPSEYLSIKRVDIQSYRPRLVIYYEPEDSTSMVLVVCAN